MVVLPWFLKYTYVHRAAGRGVDAAMGFRYLMRVFCLLDASYLPCTWKVVCPGFVIPLPLSLSPALFAGRLLCTHASFAAQHGTGAGRRAHEVMRVCEALQELESDGAFQDLGGDIASSDPLSACRAFLAGYC